MRALIATALVALPLAAVAEENATANLDAERDALIGKLTQGQDVAASTARYRELMLQRDKVVATSAAAVQKEREEREAASKLAQERRKISDEYRKTADYEVSWRCTLSPDPAHPIPSHEGRFKPDWGKVTRKESTRLPPKNALDDGEPVTMMEVTGQAGSYQFRADKFDPQRKEFRANVGDLVLVCDGGHDSKPRDLPAGWGPTILRSGFAVRLARPPLIVAKARWNPIHVTSGVFYRIIKDVKWIFPEDANLLLALTPDKDLGGGRFEIAENRDQSWIVEVPPGLKNHELVRAGQPIWMILGQYRFDRGLKKLVLVAQDVEPRYIFDKPVTP